MAKKEINPIILDFTIGEFIRDKVYMDAGRKRVKNILYYDNCIITREYVYSYKYGSYVHLKEPCKEDYEKKTKEEINEALKKLEKEETKEEAKKVGINI